jgi:hypothetical protein
VRGVAVAGGFRLNAGPHVRARVARPVTWGEASFRTLVLSRRLAALGYCLPLDQKRRLPRCTNFGVPSHGLFTRCLRFAAFLPPQRLYGHARLDYESGLTSTVWLFFFSWLGSAWGWWLAMRFSSACISPAATTSSLSKL